MEHLLFLDMGDEPKKIIVDVAEMYVDSAVSFHYNEKLDSIDAQYNLGSVEEFRKDDRSLDQPSNETLEGFGLAADNFNNSLTTTTLRCCSEPLNEPLEINKCIVETSVYALSDTQQQSALLLARSALPFLIHKLPRPKGSSFWLPAIQLLASFNLLLSLVMSLHILKFQTRHWFQSCYLWAVWFEGPLGFGLLMSSRITQAFQLYHIFLKRPLPPIRSHIFLPLILLPWVAVAGCKDLITGYI